MNHSFALVNDPHVQKLILNELLPGEFSSGRLYTSSTEVNLRSGSLGLC